MVKLVGLVLIACLAIVIAVYVVRRRLRQGAWLTRLARTFAIDRKRGESDEELRARCRAILAPQAHASEASITNAAKGIAASHGGTARVTFDHERALVSVGVTGLRRPGAVADIERELADHLPVYAALEVFAESKR